MAAFMIVEVEGFGKECAGLLRRVVGLEVDFFILDAAPKPFDEHVIAPTALAVHADADLVFLEHARESADAS